MGRFDTFFLLCRNRMRQWLEIKWETKPKILILHHMRRISSATVAQMRFMSVSSIRKPTDPNTLRQRANASGRGKNEYRSRKVRRLWCVTKKIAVAYGVERETAAAAAESSVRDRPDVVVVERKNVFVITLRVILHAAYIALRICASCAVAVLAIIGLASLIYPNIRAELVNSLGQVMDELQAFLA